MKDVTLSLKASLEKGKLAVKKSSIHGYGVFAQQDFAANDVIEECYVLLTTTSDPEIHNYYFDAEKLYALALGNGSLYNHADEPNATYQYDPEYNIVTFRAIKSIKNGEEIFISYGKDWFSARALTPKHLPPWRWAYVKSTLFLMLRFMLVLVVLIVIIFLMKK